MLFVFPNGSLNSVQTEVPVMCTIVSSKSFVLSPVMCQTNPWCNSSFSSYTKDEFRDIQAKEIYLYSTLVIADTFMTSHFMNHITKFK